MTGRDLCHRAGLGASERWALSISSEEGSIPFPKTSPSRPEKNSYLSKEDSSRTTSISYRVGHCTVGIVVKGVSAAIWEALLAAPCMEDWRAIAEGFNHCWNFPNYLGSVDGKHVAIQAPDKSGSLYYNYKSAYSMLLAVVDAVYLFRVVDVGGYGRTSDGGSLYNSAFGEGPRDGTLDLPEDAVITESEHRGPLMCVGDEAFPPTGTSSALSLAPMSLESRGCTTITSVMPGL
ncbi:hypothetical protein FQN60_018730 [Etheostoma spectabile]|uniref:DDE Tnp4 domain-containing protein n=1 Tax=Etheostoma spectabile TaxID=54343 RepID=A0A5J5CBA7_9PERO|nr:hypothetical protein FQN60_018730 [Etheostoma spectabile]